MLDIKFIRENKEIVAAGAKKKHIEVDLDKLIALDDQRLKELREVEDIRAEQNRVSNEIGRDQDPAAKVQLIQEMRLVKEDLKTKEDKLKETIDQWRALMLKIPNVPDISVPEGESEEDNREVKSWGMKPVFDFEPKDHIELMNNLGVLDLERGTKVHGFRGYFLKGQAARLSFAIWNYALDFFSAKNFNLIIPPVIINRDVFLGTGYLPHGEEDLYKVQDEKYLAGTAEVPIMGMHSGEILDKGSLPMRYLGFSPCFRREAGSNGKDVKGLIRVNEFYKVEQVILCEGNHQDSVKFHEEVNRNAEEFIESLGLPYRTIVNCGWDLGFPQVKKYDIELWVPKENKYREISSASYFHDFQTRRLNIRYRDGEKVYYAYSVNCTAIATPRILVSLVENFQQKDGSVKIPEVLKRYLPENFKF
jgi:seryl-tRNA synthetase